MFTKQLSIVVAVSVCIGLGMAWSDIKTFAAVAVSETAASETAASETAASGTKIDFDAVFDDVRQGELEAGYVDRAHKSDRLTNSKSISPEPAQLPYCEPLASPFIDPILGRIAGRCDT
jgi:hypothetical protein